MDMELDNNVPVFTSFEQEAHYWKQRAEFFQKKYEDQKEQFDEFEKYSKDIESELDLELKQYEAKNKDLTTNLQRVLAENETLKRQKEQMSAEYNAQLTDLTTEITSCRATSDEVNAYVRELEQKNDDLERANRAAVVSIQDFETRLNHAIERNAILESELDETETLREMVQRLKDETKDLEGELVRRRAGGNVTPSSTPETRDLYRATGDPKLCRPSPLTVVHDLLRKVGVLETKIVSFNKDHSLRRTLHKEFDM